MTDLSVKVLLKQAYASHISKVKYLEAEAEEFKNKFIEADRKLKEYGSECRRCAELEEAFKSCKAALHEQTKWFENLGQKFSVFNSTESANVSKKTSLFAPVADDMSSDLNFTNVTVEKSSIIKQNLLKNLMSLNSDETKDSLDLCSAPFPMNPADEYSTLNQDSLILAPDTVGLDAEYKQKDNTHKDFTISFQKPSATNNLSSSDTTNCVIVSGNSTNVKEDQELKRLSKKRQLSKTTDVVNTAKKISKGNEMLVHQIQVTESNIKYKENQPTEPDTFSGGKLKESSIVKDIDAKQIQVKTSLKNETSGNFGDMLENSIVKAKNIPMLDIKICRDITISNDSSDSPDITQKYHGKAATNIKDSSYQISPSLLPANTKKNKVIQSTHAENEDINDFQMPTVNKKSPENDGAWTVCDKKKVKKAPNMKLKTTSKFKMSLDSLPLNYKKPTYRQMKLSKSIFQPKPSTSAANNEKGISSDGSASSSNKTCIILTPVKNSEKSGGLDFDATCIPDNYAYEIVPSRGGVEKEISSDTENSNNDSVLLIGDESADENSDDSPDPSPILKNNNQQNVGKTSNDKKEGKFEDFLANCKNNENRSSFDRLPRKEEPNYKYKEETVRRRAERMQLNAYDCKECEKYFAELGLSDEEKQERLKKCSRHRSKFAPPPTPEHFWELEFPDTQECKARGYLNETQKGKLKSHRRRPL